MEKRTRAVIAVALLNDCQKADTADDLKVYYAAMESGPYYEGWADQLEA